MNAGIFEMVIMAMMIFSVFLWCCFCMVYLVSPELLLIPANVIARESSGFLSSSEQVELDEGSMKLLMLSNPNNAELLSPAMNSSRTSGLGKVALYLVGD